MKDRRGTTDEARPRPAAPWVAALAALLALSLGANLYQWRSRDDGPVPVTNESKPYKADITEILRPLRYTGLPALRNKPVRITIDFPGRKWRFENFRQYDANGSLLLADGHTGICGELTAYAHQRIEPIVNDTHDLKFMQVSRSDFFKFPQGGHLALLMIPKDAGGPSWVIDPSFRLYERVGALVEDYAFYRVFDRLEEIDRRETFVEYRVNTYMPLVIENEFVTEMGVMDVDGKFDPRNFALVLYSVRKGKYGGQRILQLRLNDGRRELIEDRARGVRSLGEKGYRDVRAGMMSHFDALVARPES